MLLLGHRVQTDFVPVIPHVPGDLEDLLDQRYRPFSAGVAFAKPFEVLLLNRLPLNTDASEEEVVPSELILVAYCVSKSVSSCPGRVIRGEALPLTQPSDDCFS